MSGGAWAERFARWIARHPGRVLGGSLLLTALALVPALRFRLETDLTAVFPSQGAPASQDYRELLTTFGGFEKVFVVVEGGASDVLIDAAGQLAAELAKSRQVAAARAGLTPEEEQFFLSHVAPRAPLLLAARGRLAELSRRLDPAEIHTHVATMRESLRGPLGPFAAPLFAADPLGLTEDLLGQLQSSLPIDPLSGAFLSRDGSAALVVVTPRRSELDAEGGQRLVADLQRACAQVKAASRPLRTSLRFTPLGGPIYAVHDEAIIRGDLVRITLGSLLSVGLILLIGFEGVWIPIVLSVAVLAGVIWTAGLVTFGFGRITVVGIGFVAALFGMGVEYGIHGGARFRALRLRGNDPAAALAGAFRETGPAIVSTAMTTAVALGALVVAHFRPLRELGVVLTVGVLAILVTTATLGAALLVLVPVGGRERSLWRKFWDPLFAGITGFASRFPKAVLAAALVLSAVAACGLPRLSLDTDLRSLRPVDHPALVAERLVVEKFGLGLDTLTALVHGDTLPAALAKASRVREILASALGPGADVSSPSDWLSAEGAAALLPLPLAAAAATLETELRAAGFRLEPFAPALSALRTLGRGALPSSPPPADWPQGMSELVHLESGRAVVAVHARTPLGFWAEGPPAAVLRALRRIDPRVAVASVPRVGAELRELALSDLRRSSLIAALLVAVVVLVSLRGRGLDSLLAGVPLLLGCLWTFGLWGLLGRDLDLLCIATLPVLFGTGIDLGVHSLHEAAHDPGGLRGAVTQAGLAMTLIALTTGAGFGSLGASRIPGLQNAGWIVSVGVTACLLATLVVLPALAALRAPEGSA